MFMFCLCFYCADLCIFVRVGCVCGGLCGCGGGCTGMCVLARVSFCACGCSFVPAFKDSFCLFGCRGPRVWSPVSLSVLLPLAFALSLTLIHPFLHPFCRTSIQSPAHSSSTSYPRLVWVNRNSLLSPFIPVPALWGYLLVVRLPVLPQFGQASIDLYVLSQAPLDWFVQARVGVSVKPPPPYSLLVE